VFSLIEDCKIYYFITPSKRESLFAIFFTYLDVVQKEG